MRTLIKNIGLLQSAVGCTPKAGSEQGEIMSLKDACIVIEDERISAVFSASTPGTDIHEGDFDKVIDACGKYVTPGLVDCHTHTVFGGWRQHEVPLKLKGASYLEILQAGGGILDTVAQTRATSTNELFAKACDLLSDMLAHGTTSLEIKSGYGLDSQTELKQLTVATMLNEATPFDICTTFLGAHATPPEYSGRPQEYIDMVCEQMLPEIAKSGLANYCDVFCETGVFDAPQSRQVLTSAKKLGFKLRAHADEINAIGGSQLAGELGAVTAEHLIAIEEDGLEALKQGKVIAALLPATSFYLDKTYAPARRMIELGIPVACASDFNPGSCPSSNMQFVINLAYLKYRMTPSEILTAVTLNGACAIGMGDRIGTVEVGKQADLIIWNAPDMAMLCYRMGTNQVKNVIKKGELLI